MELSKNQQLSGQCIPQSIIFFYDSVYTINYFFVGTHKILKGNLVSAVFPGGVNVSCNFLVAGHEKMFSGCLAVVVPNNDTEKPTYRIIHFDNDNNHGQTHTRTVGFTITGQGLKTGDYRLFVFETLGNLFLPVRFPAATEAFRLSNGSPSTGKN